MISKADEVQIAIITVLIVIFSWVDFTLVMNL